jgi:hypothetical protein
LGRLPWPLADVMCWSFFGESVVPLSGIRYQVALERSCNALLSHGSGLVAHLGAPARLAFSGLSCPFRRVAPLQDPCLAYTGVGIGPPPHRRSPPARFARPSHRLWRHRFGRCSRSALATVLCCCCLESPEGGWWCSWCRLSPLACYLGWHCHCSSSWSLGCSCYFATGRRCRSCWSRRLFCLRSPARASRS